MPVIVKKFGGTSVGSIELIRNIATNIKSLHKEGESIVLVVSAMAKTTDQLFKMAYEVSNCPSKRELDMLLTAGERISMSLLSIALHNEGLESISFTGSQSGIKTDAVHGNAHIIEVNAFRIKEELARGKVVIVAGFQGVSPDKEITTLGRGGSDTSAVALASYLNAEKCEIFTDVDGVYSADPRIVSHAKKLDYIDYGSMLCLAYCGSKVLHPRAVEFGYKYKIPVEIKSSFTFQQGTMIEDNQILLQKGHSMEERKIIAIAHKDNLIRYTLPIEDHILTLLETWTTDLFKYHVQDGNIYLYVEDKFAPEIEHLVKANHLHVLEIVNSNAAVSLIGIGINLDPSILSRVISTLHGCQVLSIDHSERSIEILVKSVDLVKCIQILHKSFIEERK